MGQHAGCALSHRGAFLELDKYSEVDTWEGHGREGEILSGKEEFKNINISDYNFKR